MASATLLEQRARVTKCLWVIEEIIRTDEVPRTCGEIARTTGMDQKLVDDCAYELMRAGKVSVRWDSKLIAVGPKS